VLGRVALVGPTAEDIKPASWGYARLRLEAPVVLTRGDRFVLRTYSPPLTIGGGLVLDPRPPLRAGVRRPNGTARFVSLDPAGDAEETATVRAARLMVAETGVGGLPVAALTSRIGVAPSARPAAIERLIARDAAVIAGSSLVSPSEMSALRQRVLDALAAHHRAEPLADGMPREELRERLFSRAGPGVFERVLDDLGQARLVVARERVALAGHRIALSGADEQAREALDRAFADAGLRPPDLAALSASLDQPPDVIDRVTKLLLRQKVLVRVDTLIFHARALARLKANIAALKSTAASAPVRIDVAAFKDRFGVSRKFAIPLLEYLDRERVTKREGDSRVIL
jgi:selenocysteine-specific elongation factor